MYSLRQGCPFWCHLARANCRPPPALELGFSTVLNEHWAASDFSEPQVMFPRLGLSQILGPQGSLLSSSIPKSNSTYLTPDYTLSKAVGCPSWGTRGQWEPSALQMGQICRLRRQSASLKPSERCTAGWANKTGHKALCETPGRREEEEFISLIQQTRFQPGQILHHITWALPESLQHHTEQEGLSCWKKLYITATGERRGKKEKRGNIWFRSTP